MGDRLGIPGAVDFSPFFLFFFPLTVQVFLLEWIGNNAIISFMNLSAPVSLAIHCMPLFNHDCVNCSVGIENLASPRMPTVMVSSVCRFAQVLSVSTTIPR